MSDGPRPKGHPSLPPKKLAVVIANLGTPDGTGYWPMRRYLSEFLSDKRVVDLPAWKWQPILQGIILTIRPGRSGAKYRSIWNWERDESPLLTITRAQADALRTRLTARFGGDILVDFAMRYGNPSVSSVITRVQAEGADRILFVPLYPQYAAPTTASANDQAFRALMKMNWQPALRTAPPWFDQPGYIRVLAQSVRDCLGAAQPEALVASYHGVPERFLLAGDPYHCQCLKTTRLLGEALDWPGVPLLSAFQSKFGREKWLGPATIDLVRQLARDGRKHIAVLAPAFVSDCVETLEELGIEVRDAFIREGGREFTYIPCLNDRPDHIDFLAGLIEGELSGWISPVQDAFGSSSPTLAGSG
jgi:ferrochelatase